MQNKHHCNGLKAQDKEMESHLKMSSCLHALNNWMQDWEGGKEEQERKKNQMFFDA